ncbi:MAG: magnesium-translocating P-type ATPase [Chloroflexota bacterium]|nr:MAG: magnesium-translocating P-type ATPase [Chloroflexota bacterium]
MDNQPQHSYWSIPNDDLHVALGSSANGLSAEMAQQRLDEVGHNLLVAKDKVSPFQIFLRQFKNPIVLILLFATVVSIFVQEWIDAIIIFAIVLGSALLSFYQEYNASNAVEKLKAQVSLKTIALRDGQKTEIPAEEIVPGDVVLLSAGSLIPADGVLLEAQDFFVNQAVLTGETFPVEKNVGTVVEDASLAERTNCVFMGTNVRSGSGKALIVETGERTAFGQIADTLNLRPPETEFERGVRHFGLMLAEIMLVMVVLIFALNVYFHKPILDSLLFSIALAVGLTPQLLPAIIGVNLSKGSQAMAKAGVIVRRLNAIENFGSMDVLCTDKTGTLTLGVVKMDDALDAQGEKSGRVFRLAYLNASLQTGLANPLDEAITAQHDPGTAGAKKIAEIPYDFVRKRMTVLVAENSQIQMATKGALDNILAVCDWIRLGDEILPLDGSHLKTVREKYAIWSEQGFRVLGVATKPLEEACTCSTADENEMIFEGFLLFFDPPKPGVSETISKLASLGVDLKIITGDNKLVAMHTAEVIGMQLDKVMTGSELNNLHDEALLQAVENTNLFAEVDPNQKERIITSVQKRGHVVGYMGDGINDAPSLHNADVGISVDSAVDVAKEAADFVLLKQDLDVLHQGILLGRTTFANTMKYIFVTTSANFGNMFSMAGASLFIPFLPLLPFQVLLTNFLTDFPAITIATDNVDHEMIDKPRRWDIAFLRKFMVTFGLVSSTFDYLTFGFLLLVLQVSQDIFRTGWFIESVMTELLIMLVIRTQRPFFQSKLGKGLFYSTLIVAIITLCLPFIPGLNTILGLTPLPWSLMLALIGITVVYVLMNEIAKRYFYRRVKL